MLVRRTTRFLVLLPVALLVLIALFFVLRPDSSATDSAESPKATADKSQEETFGVAIHGAAMTPDTITVEEGDRVTLRITTDRPLEFHLHGYDVEGEVEPGKPEKLSFDATITGRFEFEDHTTDTVLGVLLVQPH